MRFNNVKQYNVKIRECNTNMKRTISTFFTKLMSFTPYEMNNTPRDRKGLAQMAMLGWWWENLHRITTTPRTTPLERWRCGGASGSI